MFLLLLVALFLIVYGVLNLTLFNMYWKKIKGTPPVTEKKKVLTKSFGSIAGGLIVTGLITLLCF